MFTNYGTRPSPLISSHDTSLFSMIKHNRQEHNRQENNKKRRNNADHAQIWPVNPNLTKNNDSSIYINKSLHGNNQTIRRFYNKNKTVYYGKRGKYNIKDEIKILEELEKSICNTNIVKIFSKTGPDKNGYYTIYTKYAGESLMKYLYSDDKRTEKEIVHIMYNILQIISCMHKQKIYHMDLKLPNILYHNKHLTIIDFESACRGNKDGFCKLKADHPIALSSLLPEFKNNSKFKVGEKISGFEQDLYAIARMFILCLQHQKIISMKNNTYLNDNLLHMITDSECKYKDILSKMLTNHDMHSKLVKYTSLDDVITDFERNPYIAELLGVARSPGAAIPGGKRSRIHRKTKKRMIKK